MRALLLSLSFCISILPTALAFPIQADGYITDSRMETSSATMVLRHREVYPTEADFWADIAGEEGREWILRATIAAMEVHTQLGRYIGKFFEM